ncbi:3-hydroxyacyl-CoA dehydrogenase/enoyl-CoA hydratase family protein [Paenibacillus camelliae]|uniref:3-hydroxyacyl-CoA dehydrogenase/enoyl-CoA hydratase family protein n=1 Tax=Paenibacillus camelliae TaxID=512410 RepID=UPI00203C43FA|nr:3-hydroxyacyl-CoA dehydrogenase/enoyl-CoA hydratase family protein [Paenibacillus camelliae]MCM3634203.1 3-hydroxyacyl-CoA dehydrogenase NAD-binding domain-containing protein [Paenibacillus camelliae]
MTEVRKVAVIGSGIMGSGIAAHMANSGFEVWLYDIVPSTLTEQEQAQGLTLKSAEVRNRLSLSAIAQLVKQKPAPLYDASFSSRIHAANMEDDGELLHEMDWIVEAVVERLDIKQHVFSWIDQYRRQGTLVSTNTSGLSAAVMIQHCSKEMRQHFAVTHFFNPPRYMALVELVATEETLPAVTEALTWLCQQRLGKGVVQAKDTPNFIANRIGTYGMLVTLQETLQHRLTIDEVDALTGPAMGRPKTATYRMLDLVGLDTLLHVVDNVHSSSEDETERAVFTRPALLEQLVKQGALGQKSGAGFYRKLKGSDGGSYIESLQLDTMTYAPSTKPTSPVIEAAKQAKGAKGKVKALIGAVPEHPHAQFAWKTIKATLLYAAERVGEIAEHIADIDKAMRLGFNWELGPFELWDALGLAAVAERMKAEGDQLPNWVEAWIAEGNESFYKHELGSTFYVHQQRYVLQEQEEGIIELARIKEEKGTVWSNREASLIDLGDEVLALEFHSKSNAIGSDILSAIRYACHETTRNWRGLVIANEGKNFCVGANLMLLLMEAMNEEWDEVEDIIMLFQQSMLQLKRLSRPVVAAPHRMTLGGGVEACLPADIIVASPETYFGLVETGVGLIPAGGGSKEAAILAMQRAAHGAGPNGRVERKLLAGDLQPHLNSLFESIALAKTSTSGFEIARLGYARPQDRVLLRGESRIFEAKQEVLRLDAAGYVPPAEELVAVAGREGKAVMKLAIQNMKLGGYISEHDEKIATKLAHVLSGGDVPSGALVTEQYLLQLECEAFLSLCGEPKTQQRMSHMLRYGKPLRN